ncbi:MAG: winged helix-turn-helix domain-containing protein, partial [Candidatus Thorarchaeota archaeon]
MLEIIPEIARQVILDVQGLRTSKPSKSVMSVARRIHNIQIDTISVVSRSHNLITFNRFDKYKEGDIWKHLKKGDLFEYWSHAICLLPVQSFPYYAWMMKHTSKFIWRNLIKWAEDNKNLIEDVYKLVKKDGPLPSSSVGSRTEKSDGWWDLKAEKWGLECLFYSGRIMVSYRKGFQKYYDLKERVLPSGIDTEPMAEDEVPEFLTNTIASSLGIVGHKDLKTYMGKLPSKKIWSSRQNNIEAFLDGLVKEDKLVEVKIAGLDERYYVLKKYVRSLNDDITTTDDDVPVKLLSPFDNIMRERHYPREIWEFDYKIECYVPAPKRQYGYYVLPILDQHSIAGRVDAKVHRDAGLLELKSLYLESDDLKTEMGID